MSTETEPRRASRTKAPAERKPPTEHRLATVLWTAGLLAFSAYILTPLWWLVVSATKTQGDISSTSGLWFAKHFALGENLSKLASFDNHIFVRWCVNSVIYSGGGALIATVLAAMAGYALAMYLFPCKELYFNLILAAVLVPVTALTLPLFLMFSKVDQADSMWAVLVPSFVSPFGVYLGRVYAQSAVPTELLEAARIDGSSEFRTFFTIGARLMRPCLVTIFLFQFVAIWNNFFVPLVMLRSKNLYPVTLGLYSWTTQIQQQPGLRLLVIVGSAVSIAPLIVAFLLLQRFWRAGLGAGAVKG